ncbi:N-acetylmuramoyl-L-alanine amidase LytC precursor [Oxobacter pfennigii]|uniref:N-acetylmuramoyl-L-alanine amidase LytC n=1 Tax=Oxobacter pfennigii TaxID=36849 RepID=A0A0P9ADX3_9CLOT|nr:N-acetylmuramoyl-L-alanine amidase [Oxobacter pfennigii]KPU43415.1 N-acetylmuramoyl-L-alanine amidase LytC precursor [Oxobacter pfennigii]
MKICIDAGHGGKTPGAQGKKTLEKYINLELALKLRDELVKNGIEVIMTRTTDVYIELKERCDIANKNKCDYFISIHCNSFTDTSVSGTETYYYNGSKEGMELARAIQNAAVQYSKNKDRGIKTASYYVLVYTAMPAVLLETAFISNENEENMLMDKTWQEGFVKNISSAILNYLGIKPNDGTIPEEPGSSGRELSDEDRQKAIEELERMLELMTQSVNKLKDIIR